MKLVFALFALMLLVGGVSYLVWRGGAGGGCVDKSLEEVTSPGGRFVAARLSHRCGDAPAATQVALRPGGTPFAGEAQRTLLAARGDWPVRLQWRDRQTLVVETAADNLLPEPADAGGVSLVWRHIR